MHFNTQLPLLAILATNAWANPINWFTCKQNATAPVTCGNLQVPLDYTDKASKKTLNLELLKFNATKEPCKGSILFNPGGPGDSTREFLGNYAKEMLIATGGHFNLIAFEPRGLGNTLPFSCFKSETDRTAQLSKIPVTTNVSDTSLGATWSAFTGISQGCYEANKDIGSLMSTAFVARDMMQIVDALGEDGKLRFWGFSYGTVLGATVASMFPDRMDKIVMDGVVNVPEWIDGSNQEEFIQADDSLRAFFKDCLKSPETCPIAAKGKTADDLYNTFYQILEEIKFKPLVLGSNLTTDIVDYATLKSSMQGGIKYGMPAGVPLAAFLAAVIQKDAAAYKKLAATLAAGSTGGTGPIYPNSGPEAPYGIQCSDVTYRENDLAKVKPQIDFYYKTSRFGGDGWGQLLMACAQWKMQAKERYTGPFKAKTKTPMLFISSPYDPNTPMASARNMSEAYGGVVLQQNGIGHCSIAQPSVCAIKATQAYFTDGTLPKAGTVCEPEFNFFSNHTIPEIYELAAK